MSLVEKSTFTDFESPEKLRDFVTPLLHEGKVTVEFTKVNGDKRVMECTLKEDLLPQVEVTTTSKKKPNPEVMSVWATDVNGWRSFRLDSVNSVSIEV